MSTIKLVAQDRIVNSQDTADTSMKYTRLGENRKLAKLEPCRGVGYFLIVCRGTQVTRFLFS